MAPSFGTPSTSSSLLQIVAWLDRTGYVPGEMIYFNSKIENRSGKSVLQTIIQLVQVLHISSVFFSPTRNNWLSLKRSILRSATGRTVLKRRVFYGSKEKGKFRTRRGKNGTNLR